MDLGGQTPSLSNVRLQDTPSTVGVASEGDNISTTVVNFDVTIPAPEAQIVLRAKIGGKRYMCRTRHRCVGVSDNSIVVINTVLVLERLLKFINHQSSHNLCCI